MAAFGRRNRVLFLALAIIATVGFVLFSPARSPVEQVNNSLADFDSAKPVDESLLSAAQIEQNKLAPEEKVYHSDEKSHVSSGTDATLKSKEDSINKVEEAERVASAKGGKVADDDDGVLAPPKKVPAADATDADTAAGVGAKAKAGAKAGVKDDSKTEELADSKAAAKADTKAGAKAGSKAGSKADAKADDSTSDKSVATVGAGASGDYDYVIMIDAGSTGSRVHVYTFDTSVSPPNLINEDFEMLKPGLSSFDTDTVGAAASLDPLLELALKSIPKEKQSCSPVAVKATAGLRLLGTAKANAILAEVRAHIEKDYPFPVVKGDGVSIMDGSDEGVYAWITANYLLGNIGSAQAKDSAAVFDLGGGSTQIVFEPTDGEEMVEGEHKYSIEFGGRKFTLYQYSHLGYGLMQGRRRVNAAILEPLLKTNKELVALTPAETKQKNLKATVSIPNPCVPPGVIAEDVVVELDDKTSYIVNFVPTAKDTTEAAAKASATQCKLLTESILNKDATCAAKPCSFNGVYQPAFKQSFAESAEMFVFSYFYDRLQPIGMPLSFTLADMQQITQQVCSGSHAWDQYFTQPAHVKELEEEPLWCQDLNFMTSLLHIGYDIPLTRELRTAKTIQGNELGWCLGASLPLLEKSSGWACKITKDL